MSRHWDLLKLKSWFAAPDRPNEAATVSATDVPDPQPATSPSAEPATLPAEEPVAVPRAEVQAEIRPLGPRMGDSLAGTPITVELVAKAMNSPACNVLCEYFRSYPPGSIMGDKSRAMLFALIRMLRPKMVAEIGTYYAGGAEVMARALWENGEGFLHTTDPFGADRCPAIIAGWPDELRKLVEFHPLNSMDFLLKLRHQRIDLDLVLVDGDHDYELALFDLQMAARLLRPGGIIVMNDSIQTGPYQATRTFLASHPAWQELGSAIASYDESQPFAGRASQPGTGLAVLQAPDHWSIGSIPRSWGQAKMETPLVAGLSLDMPSQMAIGTLHYQAILRLFGDGAPQEIQSVGSIPVKLDGMAGSLAHELDKPLSFPTPPNDSYVNCTFEVALSWRGNPGSSELRLASIPAPLAASAGS